MHLKKVALGVVLMTSLVALPLGVGCGGDDDTGAGGGAGGGSGAGGGGPMPTCGTDPGPGDEQVWTVTSLTVPDSNMPDDVPGYNFDGLDTPPADEPDPNLPGCGIGDFDGGIDNGLAYLTELLNIAANMDGKDSINDVILEAINEGTLVVEVTVTGYDGSGNDDCVFVSMSTGEFGAQVMDAQGVVKDGVLEVDLGEFGLGIPVTGGAAANLTVYDGLLTFNIEAGSGVVGGTVDRGGRDYTVEGAATAPEGSLHNAIGAVLDAVGIDGIGPEIIDPALDSGTDSTASDGTTCAALSVGLDVTATQN